MVADVETQFIAIGRIVGTHGIEGTLKVRPYAGIPERFVGLKTVYLLQETGLTGFIIQSVRVADQLVLLNLLGISTREAARKVRGLELFVPREEQIELPEDVYFIHDLIGLLVFDKQRGCLGRVEEVIQGAGNDVYVVRGAGREYLIPAVAEFVKRIDLSARQMEVQLIEGMESDHAD